ncbi:aminoglycoside phosphotransferase family protein [Patulibacter medicamentivorans]|uniref:aminoglycoside phosphotransferase family protein n=1 Tax=Patulibacter medicamentivorans TaxID=1097667 RepID=UPI001110D83A|nr:aminoglycoside phosphotransferase family protein [Patulibacter medicamentivorans]
MSPLRRWGGRARAVPQLGRIAASVAVERLRPVRSDDPTVAPTRVADLTPAWMSRALCPDGRARVVAVDLIDGSHGTTSRHRLRLRYDRDPAPLGLPETVFAKSSPGVLQRITQAISGLVEARFYLQLREQLDVAAPCCHHGAYDQRRMATVLLLEDLVATQGATFLQPSDQVDQADAEQVVRTLATVHATFAGRPPAGFKSYGRQWRDAFALVDVESAFRRCLGECGELLDRSLRADPARTWRAVLASIAAHESRPPTLLHNDVHLGNWYRPAAGGIGLCDWQGVVLGDGARDLAYALSTVLAVDDRRAWEDDLLALYGEELHRRGGPAADPPALRDRYRAQLWGALAFWAPTFSPPRLMPGDMQPREVSGEMLRRIGSACLDHDAFAAVAA